MAEEAPKLYSTYICTNCRAVVQADDANAPTETGFCLCRRCYSTMSVEDRIPAQLRHDVEQGLREIGDWLPN